MIERARVSWRSLVARVAVGGALASAVGGAVAAVAASLAVQERIERYEREGVLSAVIDLASELDEEIAEADDEEYAPGPRTLRAMLAHELADVKLPGARAALRRAGVLVEGDREVPLLAPGACRLTTDSSSPRRACATAFHDQVLTLSVSAERERDQSRIFRDAITLGMLAGATLGALTSVLTAHWGLAPLAGLRARVGRIDARDPRANELGPPSPVPEIESLRSVISTLVERLAASLAQAQSFAAEAAHELRTPLSTIAMELELLRELARVEDRAQIARVHERVRELTSLVQRLLVLAQPGGPDWESADAVELGELADDVMLRFEPGARTRIRARSEAEVLVRGDASLLAVLLENALGNALKFSSDAVELIVSSADGHARIDVVDRGPGVPEAERERVFAPFYRMPAARAENRPGHGLGLALIARIAEFHRGRAEFLDVAEGAHLRISIPLWRSRSTVPRANSFPGPTS